MFVRPPCGEAHSMAHSVRSCFSVLTASLLLAPFSFAFQSPLSDHEVREAYFLAAPRRVHRDPDDWPVVAVALMLGIPVWTEDQDFSGAAFQLGLRIVSNYWLFGC